MRGVRVHSVRSLNGYARVRDCFAVPVENGAFHGAQAAGKLRVSRRTERQRRQTRQNENGKNDKSSFHSAPRNASKMQFYAWPARAIETNPRDVIETQLLFAGTSESVAQRTVHSREVDRCIREAFGSRSSIFVMFTRRGVFGLFHASTVRTGATLQCQLIHQQL